MIEFRRVNYEVASLNEQRALVINDFSLRVEAGERLVLLGESGCGKTTTLRLINRMLLPTSGEVIVEGRRTIDWDAIKLRRRIGYCIQDGGLFPHFTVERNIATVPLLEGWDAERVRARTNEMLELVGLPPHRFAARLPDELSGGQRQRVGVARALAADPPLLLLDEPFGALDPLTRAGLQKDFVELCNRFGKTVVFVTHDVREAMLIGTRIALMHKGKLAELSTPVEFLQSPNSEARRYVAALAADERLTQILDLAHTNA